MEKLKQLPVYWQLLILVLVAAGLYYGFYSFVTSPIYVEAAQVKEKSDALQRKNEQARIATQNIEQFRQLYVAKAAEYEELKVLLPEEREITNVLLGLQDNARASNLTMVRFSPKDDSPQGFITAKPVEVEIACNFNNLKDFYEKMAKLPRIVSITDFSVTQRPKQVAGKTIDSKFMLTAYYATPQSVLDQIEKEKAAKAAKPGAAPATPPPAAPPAK